MPSVHRSLLHVTILGCYKFAFSLIALNCAELSIICTINECAYPGCLCRPQQIGAYVRAKDSGRCWLSRWPAGWRPASFCCSGKNSGNRWSTALLGRWLTGLLGVAFSIYNEKNRKKNRKQGPKRENLGRRSKCVIQDWWYRLGYVKIRRFKYSNIMEMKSTNLMN